jgi:hypothetical protein
MIVTLNLLAFIRSLYPPFRDLATTLHHAIVISYTAWPYHAWHYSLPLLDPLPGSYLKAPSPTRSTAVTSHRKPI